MNISSLESRKRALGLESLLPAVVLFALIAIVGAVSALIMQNFQSNSAVTQYNQVSTATVNSVNAITYNSFTSAGSTAGANIMLSCSDGCPWVSPGFPLTVAITGNIVTTNAFKTGYVVSGVKVTQTATFTTSPSGTGALTQYQGNYYNITSITLTGVPVGYSGETVTATETYGATPNGQSSYVYNTIVATGTSSVIGSTASNAIGFGLLGVSTLTSFLSLIALVLVAAIIIGIVLLAFAFRGGGGGRQF